MLSKHFYLALLCFVFSTCQGMQPSNQSAKVTAEKDLCSIRYDFAIGAGKPIMDRMTCELIYTYHIICDDELKIWYFDIAPYIYTLPNGTVDGIIPGLINIALKLCCASCTRIVYLKPFKNIQETREKFGNTSLYSFMVPVLSVLNADRYFTQPYLRIMDTPGVVFISIDKSTWRTMKKMLQSLIDTWPLFLIILLLAIQGGVAIWILDAKKNPDDFPVSFTNGFLEGSWWAFVSMTTVGYGDKAPRSFLGRIFAVIWITIGITIMGIFTASLSSSLTSAALPEKTKLNELQIGFIRHIGLAYEENIIHRESGTPKGFDNMKDIIEALRRNDIDGILMDIFVFRYFLKEFKLSGLPIEYKYDIVNSKTGIGLMFSGKVFEKWAIFLNQFFDENKDAESRILKDALLQMKTKIPLDSMIEHREYGVKSSSIYIGIIKALGISSVSSLFIGIVFEQMKKYLKTKRVEKEGTERHQMGVKSNESNLDDRIEHFSQSMTSVLRAELREQIELLRHEFLTGDTNNQ